ncbi:secondary thiamine-phosphate synthase enzyme YjbQ [bacterium SCSIO 12827]|nr:secondary thiamine-phosphate synthase enzyme YjbQ [bacterium SCSIO 12827]
MRQAQHELGVATDGPGLYEITRDVAAWAAGQGMTTGLLTLYCRHTSASLTIQENADPDVCRDLVTFFERLVKEDPTLYRHTAEGPDDMPAHIRSALTNVRLSVPMTGGQVMLGTWQGIYLFEHRRQAHRRRVLMHLAGA